MDQQITPNPAVPQMPAEGPKKNTFMVIATYVLFFVPFLDEKMKNDPFMRFHARQSLGLLLCWVAVMIIGEVPFVWMVAPILQLFIFVLWVIAVVKATQGKQESVPLLGEIFKKINI